MKVELVKHETGVFTGYWVMINDSYRGDSKFFSELKDAEDYFNQYNSKAEVLTILNSKEV